MIEPKQPDWIKYYMDFADKLLRYKTNRLELLKILRETYKELNMKYPFMENGKELEDICPFTVFGAFNKGITDENRIRIISVLGNKIGVTEEVPTKFEGIPVLNNLKAWFFRYKEQRAVDDIPNLWDLYERAIEYADDQTEGTRVRFIEAYNKVMKQGCINWNITMGLYWIRPLCYLNLDGKNRPYLLSDFMPCNKQIAQISNLKKLPNAENYLRLVDLCKEEFQKEDSNIHSFPELSTVAWQTTVSDLKSNKVEAEFAKWMIPLVDALKKLGGAATPDEAREQIIQDLQLNEDVLNQVRGKTEGNKFSNEVAWARQYLVYAGIIDNSERGKWQLTEEGLAIQLTEDKVSEIIREGRKRYYDGVKEDKGTDTREENASKQDVAQEERHYKPYTEEDFFNEVFLNQEDYEAITSLLKYKKNIILQGAPGVGKTFIAKRLAYAMMEEENTERVRMVQFHQSYSYEDFIMGYRPTKEGFELKAGPFYEFCKLAKEDAAHDYFFIIDEINRGNMSKIFGELLMLIEKDKRKESITMLYSDAQIPREFSVPENIYIIGMMNTADRSLAMIDYALRRRFAFFEIEPAFDSEGFEKMIRLADNPKFNKLVQMIKSLNEVIAKDEALGNGFRIGHSYLCVKNAVEDEWLRAVIEYEIIPLIKEYWFDEPNQVTKWAEKLRGVLND